MSTDEVTPVEAPETPEVITPKAKRKKKWVGGIVVLVVDSDGTTEMGRVQPPPTMTVLEKVKEWAMTQYEDGTMLIFARVMEREMRTIRLETIRTMK